MSLLIPDVVERVCTFTDLRTLLNAKCLSKEWRGFVVAELKKNERLLMFSKLFVEHHYPKPWDIEAADEKTLIDSLAELCPQELEQIIRKIRPAEFDEGFERIINAARFRFVGVFCKFEGAVVLSPEFSHMVALRCGRANPYRLFTAPSLHSNKGVYKTWTIKNTRNDFVLRFKGGHDEVQLAKLSLVPSFFPTSLLNQGAFEIADFHGRSYKFTRCTEHLESDEPDQEEFNMISPEDFTPEGLERELNSYYLPPVEEVKDN